MSFDYKAALTCLRDARSKRGRNIFTKRFIDAVRVINREVPMFDVNAPMIQSYSSTITDIYSNELLQQHGPAGQGVAKQVSADGNCLFNAVSVALVGKNK